MMLRHDGAMITDNTSKRHYELAQDGQVAAHIAYRMHGEGTIELVHTEVEKQFEGKGLASQIAKFALDDARSRELKVIPTCSYIAGWVAKHPDYKDLVAA